MVQEFQGTRYLTMGKEGSEIIAIDDIGAVAGKRDKEDELWEIKNVMVAGVTDRTTTVTLAAHARRGLIM